MPKKSEFARDEWTVDDIRYMAQALDDFPGSAKVTFKIGTHAASRSGVVEVNSKR